MRSLALLGALVMLGGCATTSGAGASFQSRLPSMNEVVKAARAQPWGADLKQIPATVVEVGELKSVPYVSFAGQDIELNIYGDPEKPAGIEVGTKNESSEFRATLRAFIGALLEEKDRAVLEGLDEGTAVVNDGLELEVTLPTAEDGFGAWWVDAAHPAGLEAARASVGELNEIARVPVEEQINEPLAFSDIGSHPGFLRYPRYRPTGAKVYATAYYKENGVYRRRK